MNTKILIAVLLAVALLVPGCTEAIKQKAIQEEQKKTTKFFFIGMGANSSGIQTIVVNSSGKNFSSVVTEAIETYESQAHDAPNASGIIPPEPPAD